MSICSVPECPSEATRTRRTLCEKHYYRLRRTGSLALAIREPKPPRKCTIEGCRRQATRTKRTVCLMHYKRIRKTGSPAAPPRAAGNVCTVAGCDKEQKALDGYCGLHHDRYRRNGDPLLVQPNGRWTGDAATYEAVHQRLRREKGRASEHQCVDCGGAARHWSYNHRGGATERSSEIGPYSVDLTNYEPRCVSCHKAHDLSRAER